MPRSEFSSNDPDLTAIEASLSALAPAARLDRDQIFFAAGQASARQRPALSWAWPVLSASLALLAGTEAVMLTQSRAPQRSTPLVEPQIAQSGPMRTAAPAPPLVSAPVSRQPAPRYNRSARDRLTWQLARYGLDALPPSSPVVTDDQAQSALSAASLLDEELDSTRDQGRPL